MSHDLMSDSHHENYHSSAQSPTLSLYPIPTMALNFVSLCFLYYHVTTILVLLPLLGSTVMAFQATPNPPLLNVPTYSMATLNEDGSTNMNILTYATPLSIKPDRLWGVGLYKETLSYENFARTKTCVLQLLTTDHVPLVALLGGSSGRDVDKQQECANLGLEWMVVDTKESSTDIQLLPKCAHYLLLTAATGVDLVDGGSHDVAICRVDKMFYDDSTTPRDHLYTGFLRDLGIITEQGRVA
mmetsp:Transcript_28069/g.43208  ORF Transcript_28069/g.43208 Transcript_28069/m.43208 type:complete len:242 (-) Transcript_28069:176-901(-)